MSEKQPPKVVEGATTGDVEDEMTNDTAKSAEDRKAASALASLDGGDEANGTQGMDAEAAKKALGNLGDGAGDGKKIELPVRNVKVEAADVTLLVQELEVTKPKATELLKANEGNAVSAMRAYIKA